MEAVSKVTRMVRLDDEISLGSHHVFAPVNDQHGNLVGWLHTHPDARCEGRLCQSFCSVQEGLGPVVHQVVSSDPITLEPDVECRVCGVHGRVVDGKWEAW